MSSQRGVSQGAGAATGPLDIRTPHGAAHPKAVDAGERHAVGRQVTCC